MVQIILYPLFVLAGGAGVFFFFKMRLKKINVDLNQKVDNVMSYLTPGITPAISGNSGSEGVLGGLESLGDKIEQIKNSKTGTSVPPPAANNESKEKTENLKKRFDNLQVVNELGQRVTSSLKLEETFKHLYETINSIMDAAVFELGIFTWRDNRWKILSNIDIKNNGDMEYKNHIAEWCLQNNREILLDDAEKDFERYVFKPLSLQDGRIPQSIISFPVYRQDKEVGAITVMSFSKKAFNDYHIEMIRSLIPYTAVAIGNALIYGELQNTQTQLIHNEKMASLGQIASGIAHEILNPINFVNSFSQLSIDLVPEIDSTESKEEQIELKTQLVGNLDKIHLHGQRAYSIVKSMMLLSRSGNGEKSKIDVNRSIDEYLNIAINGFKGKVNAFDCKLEKVVDNKLPSIQIVTEDFGTVLLNIFSNAFYTMNEKRKKINSISNASALINYEPQLNIKTALINSAVVITISDNGLGIPEEILGKIFLPFFTTKPTGEGTGLGLSISHDIITKGSNGELNVKSEIGKGSEFKITIPFKVIE